MGNPFDHEIEQAARIIADADALVISAGAGMGVDSGLPDFRGREGFWRAYPAYAKLGLDFVSMANPHWFEADPSLAWGFYGHRLQLYQRTAPHEGFTILRRWAERTPHGAFVFTSNVDGQFQRAGYDRDRIHEIHGSIKRQQCLHRCGAGLFVADNLDLVIDESTFRAAEPLPSCPDCGRLARPNILMFGDFEWDSRQSAAQKRRLWSWLNSVGGARLAIVECGAGTAVPSVRRFSEQLVEARDAELIRINPREPEAPRGHVSLPLGALEALRAIDARLPAHDA